MNNRVTSDSANSVSLFPFLAVLLCTMGALLVLLVVLADRAGKRVAVEAVETVAGASQPAVASAIFQKETSQQAPSDDSEEAAELVRQLDEVHAYQKQLAELRQQADQRLQEEKQRLSHLEEHTRRMEHELARLSLAAEQLKATEENQTVDQEQAEHELTRLQKLILETEAEIEELREESQGKHSYAIVPYRGPNGTYRKPIYIECRKDAVILHPEGIRLQPSDFLATSWPGNPLAAALRATRDHVNAQAAKAGASEPPDPYPMILVRPDGIRQYSMVRAAITSWDASFGYEFIDSDWKLDFPEGPDPALMRVQQHAILLARERLVQRIRSAPRRFQGLGLAGTASGVRGGTAGSHGYGEGLASASETGEDEFSAGEQLERSQQGQEGQGSQGSQGSTGKGNAFAANQLSADNQSASDPTAKNGDAATGSEMQYGAMTGAGSATGESDTMGEFADGASESAEDSGTSGSGELGERYSQAGGSAEGSESASSGSQGGNSGSASSGSPSAGGSSSSATGQASSIADSQGRNWAVQARNRGAVPIRRPIRVVVRQDQLALLPSRHALGGDAAAGKVILLNQPIDQISNEFVAALRSRIDAWGLAGNGLYWRPVLKLSVGPGAKQTAEQVLRLLKDSGVEIRLPDTALTPNGGTRNATR